MIVKIFQATGPVEIRDLKAEINEWTLDNQPDIKFVDTAMCQIADAPSSKHVQHYVVSVWYS